MTPHSEPCGHVWGPWEDVLEGKLGDPSNARRTGDRVRLCVLCGRPEVEREDDDE